MPHNEDSLCFEVIFCFDDVLGKVFSIVRNLSPHVVNHEGLSEIVLVVGERHCLEVECHQSTAFNITESVLTCSSVHVDVEEFSNWGAILREIRVC